MFKKKTLFIIGAGASAEFGLPVGTKLAGKIAHLLTMGYHGPENSDGVQLVQQLYNKHPLPNRGYHLAAQTINEGVEFANSIDDFLDRHAHNELIQRVGKAAIVRQILTEERHCRLNQALTRFKAFSTLEDTWYFKFFRMLGARVITSNARQIFDNTKFIVFNYDRCLEQFLITALQRVYRMGENEAVSAVNDCDIIHPYGLIAELPYGRSGIPFGGGHDSFDWDCVSPSTGIKIFTEQIAAGELLQQLHAKLFWADQIVFLGFGYIEENMILLRPAEKMPLKPVFGTAYEMSFSSIDEVKEKLARLFSGGRQGILPAMLIENQKCAELFDDYALRLPA